MLKELKEELDEISLKEGVGKWLFISSLDGEDALEQIQEDIISNWFLNTKEVRTSGSGLSILTRLSKLAVVDKVVKKNDFVIISYKIPDENLERFNGLTDS